MEPPKIWPQTVAEAAQYLRDNLAHTDIDWIRNLHRNQIAITHFTLGMWVRNNFGLWQDNRLLMEDTGQTHPDDASHVIIERLWIKLQAEKAKPWQS